MLKSSVLFSGYLLLGILFFGSSTSTLAQSQLGIRTDNYSGFPRIHLNPAANINSPLNWDINLLGIHAFVDNNYAYLGNTSLIHLLKNSEQVEVSQSLLNAETPSTNLDAIVFDLFDQNKVKSVHAETFVLGPSVRFKVKKTSWGLYTAARMMTSVEHVDPDLGYYAYYRIPKGNDITIDRFDFGSMALAEGGINFATRMVETNQSYIDVGITVKYLSGFESIYLDHPESSVHQLVLGDSIVFDDIKMQTGLSSSLFSEGGSTSTLEVNGKGFAVDLGMYYTLGEEDDYRFRIGASLLDIGKVNFKKNATNLSLETTDRTVIYFQDTEELEQVENTSEFSNFLSSGIYGGTLEEDQQFSMWMPTGLSVQMDINLAKNLFLNSTIVQRLDFKGPGVDRANLISLNPRFESRWFGFSLPLVLYNYQDFRAGASLRMGPLSIGSDNIMSIFKRQTNFTGTDIYASLKISPWRIKMKKKNKKNDYGCPAMNVDRM